METGLVFNKEIEFTLNKRRRRLSQLGRVFCRGDLLLTSVGFNQGRMSRQFTMTHEKYGPCHDPGLLFFSTCSGSKMGGSRVSDRYSIYVFTFYHGNDTRHFLFTCKQVVCRLLTNETRTEYDHTLCFYLFCGKIKIPHRSLPLSVKLPGLNPRIIHRGPSVPQGFVPWTVYHQQPFQRVFKIYFVLFPSLPKVHLSR